MGDTRRSKTSSPQAPSSPAQATNQPTSPAGAASPGTDDQIPLEAEEAEGDNDSIIDEERLSSYTATLASSAVDYPIEYGRRYYAFRPGS
ncbi:UMTA methyltransferase [Colletotrichum plurivorum]|uniref:UMTA methyltransferase n=1 Tax=Colletotrichum plurivorum TaxID=2175906 RepID=A0A8H6ND81_9PEZI|nr:UMTA methyltransferase [Colletotrichum plurivorum]